MKHLRKSFKAEVTSNDWYDGAYHVLIETEEFVVHFSDGIKYWNFWVGDKLTLYHNIVVNKKNEIIKEWYSLW